jgi:hypothetical protein
MKAREKRLWKSRQPSAELTDLQGTEVETHAPILQAPFLARSRHPDTAGLISMKVAMARRWRGHTRDNIPSIFSKRVSRVST